MANKSVKSRPDNLDFAVLLPPEDELIDLIEDWLAAG